MSPTFLPALFAALFGFSLGSFGSVLLSRIPAGETLHGRSHCPHCREMLHWYDLIPLLSFLLLKGQCRYCKKSISWKYPFMEAITALCSVLLITALAPLPIPALLALSTAAFAFLLIAFYDFETKNIPDVFIAIAFLSALLFQTFVAEVRESSSLQDAFLGAAVPLTFFGGLWLMSRGEWIGSGDILLGVAIGLLLGLKFTLLALFLAYTLGACVALVLLLSGRAQRKSRLAFGPFLSGGALLALFFGDWFLHRYYSFFV